jgi:uncharacterized protein (TIGR02391 family)
MKKKKIIKKQKRVLTAADNQNIRIFAEQLGALIPLSGYRSSFSLSNIAKEFGLQKYIPKKYKNKKEAFAEFMKKVIVKKPRTLKKIVREILPKAIEKRHREGNPILEDEALELSEQLFSLKVDLREEIKDLKFPKERPKIVPPPIEIQKILDSFSLHPVLLPDCKKMFFDGHVNDSVRKALERFEKNVQSISGLHDKQGADLMALVFSEDNPKIALSDIKIKSGKNKQMGFKFISMGIMHWWRNNLSHGDEPQISHHDALGRLILVSNLFHELDERMK